MMKIWAQQGDDVFLIAEDVWKPQKGQILDMDRMRLYAPQNFLTIIAQGYWENFNGDQADLPAMLERVDTPEKNGLGIPPK